MTTNVANGSPAPQPAVHKPWFLPLPDAKTITMTMAPDWNQDKLNSPFQPTHMKILLGPPGTTPATATWSFEYKLHCQELSQPMTLCPGEQEIVDEHEKIKLYGSKNLYPAGMVERAILWQDGQCLDKYRNCVELSGCQLDPDLKTHSITMRPYASTKDISLIWRNCRVGDNRETYLKIKEGTKYYINLTFKKGSTVAQRVGNQGWIPIIYIYSKNKEGPNYFRQFTNFVPNWAQRVEPDPSPAELDDSKTALQKEAEEDREYGGRLWERCGDFAPITQQVEAYYQRVTNAAALSFAARVEGNKFDEAMKGFVQEINPASWKFISEATKRYIVPAHFSGKLRYAVNRIWNAIKAIFGKSDWMVAHALFKKAIDSASWSSYLKMSNSGSIASKYMLKLANPTALTTPAPAVYSLAAQKAALERFWKQSWAIA